MEYKIDKNIYSFYEGNILLKQIEYINDKDKISCNLLVNNGGPSIDELYENYIVPINTDDRKIKKWKHAKGTNKYAVLLSDGTVVKFGNKKIQYPHDTTPISNDTKKYINTEATDKLNNAIANSVYLDGRLTYKVKYTPLWFEYTYLHF